MKADCRFARRLTPEMQTMARKSLMDGLIDFDRKRGSWNGPIDRIALGADWGVDLGKIEGLSDIPEWTLAVVLESGSDQATVGVQPDKLVSGKLSEDRKSGPLFLETMKWARGQRTRSGLRGRCACTR